MPTLLNYSLQIDPNPFTVGTTDGQLTLLVANSTDEVVELKGIVVSIYFGMEEKDLTDSPKQIKQVLPSGWKKGDPNISNSEHSYAFVLIPQSGESITVQANSSITFKFTNIKIDSQGIAEIIITEGSSDSPTKNLQVSKFPSGWGTINFNVSPANFINEGNVTLNWSGPDTATYTIEYLDPITQLPITIPKKGQSPLGSNGPFPGPNDPPLSISKTTTFSLFASAIISGQNYITELQQQVTVGEIPTVNSFEATISGDPYNQSISLIWDCSDNTEHVLVSWNDDLKSPSPSSPETLELPFSSNSFSVTAVSGTGMKSEPQIINISLIWQTIQDIEIGKNINDFSMTPDSRYVLVTYNTSFACTIDLNNLGPINLYEFSLNSGELVISPDGEKCLVLPLDGNHIELINIPKLLAAKPGVQWVWQHSTKVRPRKAVITADSNYWYAIDTLAWATNNYLLFGNFNDFFQPILPFQLTLNPQVLDVTPKESVSGNLLLIGDANGEFYFLKTRSNGGIVSAGQVSLNFWMHHLAVSSNGQYALVPNSKDKTIFIIDLKKKNIAKTLDLSIQPGTTVITKDCKKALVIPGKHDETSTKVIVLDLTTLSAAQEIPTGNKASSIALSDDNKFAFIGNDATDDLLILDLQSLDTAQPKLTVLSCVNKIKITPDNKTVVVGYTDQEKVSILQQVWVKNDNT